MKPVAWMIIDVDNGKSLQSKESKFSEINIPLYASPRELSDEEIDLIAKPFLENMEGYSYYGESLGIPEDRYIDFARAILKKASGT